MTKGDESFRLMSDMMDTLDRHDLDARANLIALAAVVSRVLCNQTSDIQTAEMMERDFYYSVAHTMREVAENGFAVWSKVRLH